MSRRTASLLALALIVTPIAACSSDSDKSATTTTEASRAGFDFQTADGQVSLSLDGNLPPNWPADFPVPSGATAAGSGSLGSDTTVGFVAVFSTDGSPEDAYDFYTANDELTVDSSSSLGSGDAYVGTVAFSGTYSGRVTVAPYDGQTLIVVVLEQDTTAGGSSDTTVASQ